MAFPRKRAALQFTDEERRRLESIRRSRTEQRRRTVRAAILLDSSTGVSDGAIAARLGVSRGTVVLCIGKCLRLGLDAALGDLPRSGKPRTVPDDSAAWVMNLACQKPKALGYSYELWTYRLLNTHVRRHCSAAGHPALRKLSRSKLHKILLEGELRPHRVRYYVERRDPGFDAKMAHVLHVYKEIEIVNQGLARGEVAGGDASKIGMATISYDEKPGIQALAVTSPDRPPVVVTHASHLRDYEYERLGTVSLLAGLDLHTGKVTEIVKDTHASADFIEFLKKLDAEYPAHMKIRLLLDNHSAHISRETGRYLDTVPQRFAFVFTPTHGSWLNIVETLFSKMTRTMLREIRVGSKQELIDRIHQYFAEINAMPVVFRWKYKMDEVFIV
jgi:transposase